MPRHASHNPFVSLSHPSRIIGTSMPSFLDSAVIIVLALLLFGPKKLPVLARQLGKLMADFRRASNEFRTQMEEELRISEQADRQKQLAAIEAAAPATPAIAAAARAAPAPRTPAPRSRRRTRACDPIRSRRTRYDPEPSDPSYRQAEPPLRRRIRHPAPHRHHRRPQPPCPHPPACPSPTRRSPKPRHPEAELETETLHG